MEFGPEAERAVDVRFTQRMLEIELADLSPGDAATDSLGSALFFRVIAEGDGTIEVELWDRGELLGKRSVSISMGRSRLLSRRIALAAVELARRAPQQIAARQERQAEAAKRCLVAEGDAQMARTSPRLSLGADVGGYTMGPGESWLFGAELRPTLEWPGGSAIGIELDVLQGRYRSAAGKPHLRWLETALVPGHDFELAPHWSVGVSLPVGFATVFTRGADELTGVPEQDVTWSARARLVPRVSRRLGDSLWLEFAPSIGWTLREIAFRDSENAKHSIDGLWLGASIGFSAGPRH